MKKTLCILLIAAFTLGLIGCSQKPKVPDELAIKLPNDEVLYYGMPESKAKKILGEPVKVFQCTPTSIINAFYDYEVDGIKVRANYYDKKLVTLSVSSEEAQFLNGTSPKSTVTELLSAGFYASDKGSTNVKYFKSEDSIFSEMNGAEREEFYISHEEIKVSDRISSYIIIFEGLYSISFSDLAITMNAVPVTDNTDETEIAQ